MGKLIFNPAAEPLPAVTSSDDGKVLLVSSGEWEVDTAPGARIYVATTSVTNVSGEYSNTVQDENLTTDMIAMRVELGDASVFHGNITVSPGSGEYTVSCPDVTGTSTLKVFFSKQQQNPLTITSTEFDILDNRLSAVENVSTKTPVTIASTDWELSNGTYTYTWESSLVTEACDVAVIPQDGADAAGITAYWFDKVTGGIQVVTNETPTGNLPVIFKVMNARLSQLVNLTGDDIASDAITGCANVDAALTNLDGRIGVVPSGKTVEGQITELNGKLTIGNITIISGTANFTINSSMGRKIGNIVFLTVTGTASATLDTLVALVGLQNTPIKSILTGYLTIDDTTYNNRPIPAISLTNSGYIKQDQSSSAITSGKKISIFAVCEI